MAEQSNTLSITPGNAKYDWSYYSFDPNVMRQGFRFTYNDTPVVYVPAEFVSKGLYTAGQEQYYSAAYLDRDIYNYLKPASVDSSLFSGTKGGEFLSSNFQNPYDGYIIDEATWKRFGGDKSVTKISPYTASVGGDEKLNAPIQGISEVNGQLVYAGMRGGERAGEYTTYNAEGQSSLNAWKQSSGYLKRGASGIAEFFNNIPAIGKIAIALTVPGAAQAMAGFNVGQAIGRGDWGSAVISALPLVVPGADGKPPIITVPGVDKAVGFISDSLNVSQSVAGALLQDGIKFAATGGDLSSWLKSQAAQFIGDQAGGFVAGLTKQVDLPSLQKMSRAMTTESTKALLLNQDVGKAAAGAFATYAVPMAFKSVPGYSEWAAKNPTTANGLQAAAIAAAKGGDPVSAVQDYTKRVFIESALPLAEKSLSDAGIKITDNQRALMRQSLTAAVQGKPLDSALQNYAIAELQTTVKNEVAQQEGWASDAQKQGAKSQYGPAIKPDDYNARQQGWEDLAAKQAATQKYGLQVAPADAAAKDAGWDNYDQKLLAQGKYGATVKPAEFQNNEAKAQGWEDLAAKQTAVKKYGADVTPAEYTAVEAGWQNANERADAIVKYGTGTTPDKYRQITALRTESDTKLAQLNSAKSLADYWQSALGGMSTTSPNYAATKANYDSAKANFTAAQNAFNTAAQQLGAATAGTTSGGLTVGSVAPVVPTSGTPTQTKEVPEQTGIKKPEEQKTTAESIRDLASKAAESALGALIPSAEAAGPDKLILPEPKATESVQPSDYKYFFDVAQSADREAAYAALPPEKKAAVDRALQEYVASSQERQVELAKQYTAGTLMPTETPTEAAIDSGALGGKPEEPVTPTIPETTPTEEFIDRGGLGGVTPTDQELRDIVKPPVSEEKKTEAPVDEVEQAGVNQQSIMDALARQQAETDAAIAALERATGQRITEGDTGILSQLAQQSASQRQMEEALRGQIGGISGTLEQQIAQAAAKQQAEQDAMAAALRGEIGGLGTKFQKDLLDAMAAQGASQAEMEAALRGEISGVGSTFERSLQQAMAQQGASQAEMEAALRGEIGGLGGTLQQQIAAAAARQEAEQEAMEAALRGEIGGLGTTFDKRLAEILAQQEQEQAGMETALRGYDQRIVELMRQGQTEQQAMQQALAEVQESQAAQQAATQQQITGVQTGLGQQISGLGKSLGEALSGVQKQFGTTTQGLQQQIQQTQQQAGMGNLLAMLGMMQQKKQEAPPIPLVGEIKPFEFSTDLLEGIYQPSRTGLLGANDQLLKMTRG